MYTGVNSYGFGCYGYTLLLRYCFNFQTGGYLLSGTIPSEISYLSNLRELVLGTFRLGFEYRTYVTSTRVLMLC